MTPDKAAAEPLPDPSGVRGAIDRYRDLAKYLVTVFAAIGGLLVAGTQLTSIGALSWSQTPCRIVALLAGMAVAIWAVAWIVLNVLAVLRPVELSLDGVVADHNLSAEINKRPSLLGPFESVAELKGMLDSSHPGSKQRIELQEGADYIVDQAAYCTVEKRFDIAKTKMLIGAVIGVLGILALTWGANPPKAETADPVARPLPVVVSVKLTGTGRDLLEGSLGDNCGTDEIAALSIGGTETAPRVVTLPQDDCNPVQFTLSPLWGKVTSTQLAPEESEP